MLLRFIFLLLPVCLALEKACPSYASLRQPSVSPGAGFSMKRLEGLWHVLATSEPTMPAMCKHCGAVLDFKVYEADYSYAMTTLCDLPGHPLNMTMTLGGHLGHKGEEGDCEETVKPWNHTIESQLMPNMFFNYTEDWYMSYACGAQLSVLNIRSFFLATRNPANKTRAWIEEKISWAKSLGVLEGWEHLVIAETDEQYIRTKCWAPTGATEANDSSGLFV
eukprot:TRINITY_DN125409_c0_g1_i1.p1 TRINITY_DN125409_c0_g1~~TRINITY_DN125409_c0_g1_i1.p1  ORF type:complete len:221 (-),score=45.91 TRINITY_DN125409_c0_g1_i1:39-701(-)